MTTRPDSLVPPFDAEDLDKLLSALADGLLPADDRARLESLLLENASARRRYLEFMQTEFLLASEIGYGETTIDRGGASGWRRSRFSSPTFLGGVAAALLVMLTACTAGAWWLASWRGGTGTAWISAVQDAVWSDGQPPVVGKPVPQGPCRLERGSIQITFPSGAVTAVQAPTALEILGANRMFLRSGRVTPFVPSSAQGFTVVSPGGEVVDFGTEFSIGVDRDGKTNVFVIDGEVAMAGGSDLEVSPMHLTQGFAGRFAVGEGQPAVTLRPLLIDHFDAVDGPLLRRDLEADQPSQVRDGKLRLPIDGRPHRRSSSVYTAIENEFSALAGRRSVISFKAALPNVGTAHFGRWVALVVDDGEGAPPHATDPDAQVAIMLSPYWKVGMKVAGETVRGLPSEAFRRSEDAVGPFQVVMVIDDSPAAHAEHGQAVVTAMVNGLEFIRDYPMRLPNRPRLSLHTHVRPNEGGVGYALIDDFSVSIDAENSHDVVISR